MDYTEKDYVALMKRYLAAQASLADLERQLKRALNQIAILEAEKKQWEEQKVLQSQIIQQQLGNSDNVVRQLQDEIRRIKKQYNIKD